MLISVLSGQRQRCLSSGIGCVIGKCVTPANYRDSLLPQSARAFGAGTRVPTNPSTIEISLMRMSLSPSLASPLTLTADHLYAPRTDPNRSA